MNTQDRPLEIVSKLGEFSIEVSCLLEGPYRLLSQSIASRDVFEGDFWGESVAEFSHSLGQKRTRGRHESNPLGLGTDGEPQRRILVQN